MIKTVYVLLCAMLLAGLLAACDSPKETEAPPAADIAGAGSRATAADQGQSAPGQDAAAQGTFDNGESAAGEDNGDLDPDKTSSATGQALTFGGKSTELALFDADTKLAEKYYDFFLAQPEAIQPLVSYDDVRLLSDDYLVDFALRKLARSGQAGPYPLARINQVIAGAFGDSIQLRAEALPSLLPGFAQAGFDSEGQAEGAGDLILDLAAAVYPGTFILVPTRLVQHGDYSRTGEFDVFYLRAGADLTPQDLREELLAGDYSRVQPEGWLTMVFLQFGSDYQPIEDMQYIAMSFRPFAGLASLTGHDQLAGGRPAVLSWDDIPQVEANVVYYFWDSFRPVAVSKNGRRQIPPGQHWYAAGEAAIDREIAKSIKDQPFYIYDSTQPAAPLAICSFGELRQYTNIARLGGTRNDTPLLAVNHRSDLLPPNLAHTAFTPENQEHVPQAAIQFTQTLLDQYGLGHTPPLISDLWTFDLDGDGQEEHFFLATNYAYAQPLSPARASLPATPAFDQQLGYYLCLAMLSESLGQQEIFSYHKLYQTYNDLTPGVGTPWLYSLQYNENGQICALPHYGEDDLAICSAANPAFADLDGDGQSEILLFVGSTFNSLQTYFLEGGAWQWSYMIALPSGL